jgi:hypothetical protein
MHPVYPRVKPGVNSGFYSRPAWSQFCPRNQGRHQQANAHVQPGVKNRSELQILFQTSPESIPDFAHCPCPARNINLASTARPKLKSGVKFGLCYGFTRMLQWTIFEMNQKVVGLAFGRWRFLRWKD